ncbi:helix-turn-helix transcriptional regulator [Paucilactobacillus suebicus]|nr:helix-turn-helix transcriptional regulator [Paucilactobacillus suebicus]
MNAEDLGKHIQKIRINKGMTMREFGAEIDSCVRSGTVNNWEHGKNKPNKRRLKAIADMEGITVSELLGKA